MDYGCNRLIKIHFITVSQISKERQCKTLHQGRTNKILFHHWMLAAARTLILCVSAHIRYTHTRALRGESGHCSAAQRYPILELAQIREHFYSKQGLSLRPRIYRTESGKTAGRRPLPNQINSDGHRWTNWLYIYTDSHSRPCRVYCGALAFDSPKRGT